MIQRASLPSRDHVLFVVAALIGGIAFWLFINPADAPGFVTVLETVVSDLSLTAVAAIVTFVLLGIAVAQLITGVTTQLDRSPILDSAPETPSETPVPESAAVISDTFETSHEWFKEPGEAERHIAMYGRRIRDQHDIPEHVGRFLDELAVTARDTYATAESCDQETAEQAIATGTWTDDRVAAAFLASDIDADPSFTTWERVLAWLAPQRAFEHRVERVIAAIEATAGIYLTYENPTHEEDAGSTDDERLIDA